MTPDKNALGRFFLPWTRRAMCSAESSERDQCDLPVQRAAADPQPAQCGRLDPGGDRRARPAALKPSFMPIDRSGDAFFLDLCEGDEGGHAQSHLY